MLFAPSAANTYKTTTFCTLGRFYVFFNDQTLTLKSTIRFQIKNILLFSSVRLKKCLWARNPFLQPNMIGGARSPKKFVQSDDGVTKNQIILWKPTWNLSIIMYKIICGFIYVYMHICICKFIPTSRAI